MKPDALTHLIHTSERGLDESAYSKEFNGNKNEHEKPDSSSTLFGWYGQDESVNQPIPKRVID